jgi:hypothetical protein
MAPIDKIAAALATRLNTLNLPTHWENGPSFTPPATGAYLKESFMPGEALPFGVFQADILGGIYQVTVMARKGSTKGGSIAEVSAVLNAFPRGLRLVYSGQSVTILTTWRSGGFESGDRWAVPVSIRFRGVA